MPELLLGYWPAWLALAVASLIGFNKLVEESGKFAAFFGGPIQRMHDRSVKRHQAAMTAEELAAAVLGAVSQAQKLWQSEENEALRVLDDRLDSVSRITGEQKKDLDELRFQLRCMTSYTEYEALWHHRLRMAAARTGGQTINLSELPDHVDYYEFEPLFRANTNWRNWAIPR